MPIKTRIYVLGFLFSFTVLFGSEETEHIKKTLDDLISANTRELHRDLKSVRSATLSKLQALLPVLVEKGENKKADELTEYIKQLQKEINSRHMTLDWTQCDEALLVLQYGETTENLLKHNFRGRNRQFVKTAIGEAERLARSSASEENTLFLESLEKRWKRMIPLEDHFTDVSPQKRIVLEGELMPFKRLAGQDQKVEVHKRGPSYSRDRFKLVWHCKEGDRFTLSFTVPRDGLYNLSMNCPFNRNHGTFKYSLDSPDDTLLEFHHQYHAILTHSKIIPLGIRNLSKGVHRLIVETLAPHPLCVGTEKGAGRNQFGLDCLCLEQLNENREYPTMRDAQPAELESTQWVFNNDSIFEELSFFPGGLVLWTVGEDPLLGKWSRLSEDRFSISNEVDSEKWIIQIDDELDRGRIYKAASPNKRWLVTMSEKLFTAKHKDSFYCLIDERQYGGGREKAVIMAEALGGHLVKVEDEAENRAISSLRRFSRWYIGVHCKKKWGEWEWDDGSPVEQFFWRENEPNNFKGNDERAVTITNGKWSDLPLGPNVGVRGAIVEYPREK